MREVTERLWVKQNHHDGDRLRLFAAVAGHVDATEVLYAGSYVDVAASFVFPAVTYVDADRRAARFFDDAEGVGEIVAAYQVGAGVRSIRFVAGDYAGEPGSGRHLGRRERLSGRRISPRPLPRAQAAAACDRRPSS